MKISTARSILDRLINDERMTDAEGIACAIGAQGIDLVVAHRASITKFVSDYKQKSATSSTRLRLRDTDRFRRGDITPAEGSIARDLWESFPYIQARSALQIRPRFLQKDEIVVPDSFIKRYPNYHQASYAYTRYYILRGIRRKELILVRQ
jgi:hypothetical protein